MNISVEIVTTIHCVIPLFYGYQNLAMHNIKQTSILSATAEPRKGHNFIAINRNLSCEQIVIEKHLPCEQKQAVKLRPVSTTRKWKQGVKTCPVNRNMSENLSCEQKQVVKPVAKPYPVNRNMKWKPVRSTETGSAIMSGEQKQEVKTCPETGIENR